MIPTKKLLIAGGALLLIGTVSWFTYDSLFLRVAASTPKSQAVPNTAQYIKLHFNDRITSIGGITFGDTKARYDIDGTTITVYRPGDILETDKSYRITLRDIQTQRKKAPAELVFSFRAKYIPFSDQPEEIQNTSTGASDSGQVNDPFFLLPNPIGATEDLPFYITTYAGQHVESPYVEVTFLSEVRDFDTGKRQQVSHEEAEQLYSQALDYIRSRGGTPEKYDIRFSNDYLNDKYKKKE